LEYSHSVRSLRFGAPVTLFEPTDDGNYYRHFGGCAMPHSNCKIYRSFGGKNTDMEGKAKETKRRTIWAVTFLVMSLPLVFLLELEYIKEILKFFLEIIMHLIL
jgi:hypothetical protein